MGARLVAWVAAMALFAVPVWAEGDCRAWPGEPSPLPTSTDPDGALARWAQLRSLELRALAERSARDAITIDRLLRHADCLAPLRAPPPEAPTPRRRLAVRIHRPGLAVASRGSEVEEAETVADALAYLGEPLPIARRGPPPRRLPEVQPPPTSAASVEVAPTRTKPADVAVQAPVAAPQSPGAIEPALETSGVELFEPAAAPMSVLAPEPPAVSSPPPRQVLEESWLADAEASLAGARFEETLEMAAEGWAALDAEPNIHSRRTQAELEVLGGAAALALGREEDAAEHFARARSLDPQLALDPSRHSPKVIRAFSAEERSP